MDQNEIEKSNNKKKEKKKSALFKENLKASITRIQITGLSIMPTTVKGSNGKSYQIEEIDRVLNVYKTNLPVNEDWELYLEFE